MSTRAASATRRVSYIAGVGRYAGLSNGCGLEVRSDGSGNPCAASEVLNASMAALSVVCKLVISESWLAIVNGVRLYDGGSHYIAEVFAGGVRKNVYFEGRILNGDADQWRTSRLARLRVTLQLIPTVPGRESSQRSCLTVPP